MRHLKYILAAVLLAGCIAYWTTVGWSKMPISGLILGFATAALWAARWKIVAWIVSRPAVSRWIYRRAIKTPYWHLKGYMDRYWLFNPTEARSLSNTRKYPWLPLSIRVHHILRRDYGRDPHNHPWPFRTILMDGWYVAEEGVGFVEEKLYKAGDTNGMGPNDYHSITQVSPGGVWTLFIMFKWTHNWGYMTPDGFVPRDQYQDEMYFNSNGFKDGVNKS